MWSWYDEESGTIVPQATTVNEETGEVTATVTHFSQYYLGDIFGQNRRLNSACVIDSYYGTQESLDIIKTNITNTVLEYGSGSGEGNNVFRCSE